jgi:hypothetical protein
MKFLDEQIIIQVNLPFENGLANSGIYKYQVYNLTNEFGPQTIFLGSIFLNAGSTVVNVDITEIVRNYITKIDIYEDIVSGNFVNKFSDYSGIQKLFNVGINIDGNTYTGLEYEYVLMWYRYPNLKYEMNANLAYAAEDDAAFSNQCLISLQGRYFENSLYQFKLTPRYPYIQTNNYALMINGYVGSDITDNNVTIERKGFRGSNPNLKFYVGTENSFFCAITLTELFKSAVPIKNSLYIQVMSNKIAIIDECPARYYLMWQDRAGSYQSQPFDKINTFSESFNREFITNHRGNKLLNFINVSPKIKIQSGYLSDEIYPYYESIFTSPFLMLYDTKEDKSYLVNITGDYTEKTFKNQGRQMFNLQLELEFTKQQNIIY